MPNLIQDQSRYIHGIKYPKTISIAKKKDDRLAQKNSSNLDNDHIFLCRLKLVKVIIVTWSQPLTSCYIL
jgi:hypothetical protein